MNQARRDFAAKLLSQPAVCLAEVYRKRGDVEFIKGIYKRARMDYAIARELFLKNGCYNKHGEVDEAIGNMLLNMGSFTEAENSYQRALGVFLDCKDLRNTAKCYRELGKVYQFREDSEKALLFYNKSLDLYEQLNDQQGRLVVLEYMADAYSAKGNYIKALEMIDGLDSFYNETLEYASLCRINKLTGYIYMGKGDNDLSLKYLKRAYQYSEKTGESSMEMFILCDLGLASYNLNSYTSAITYFEQCLNMAEKLDSAYMKAVSLVNLADTWYKIGNIERSRACINRAATINHNIGGLTSEIQRIQEEIAQKEGDQEKAGQEKSRETQGRQVPHAT